MARETLPVALELMFGDEGGYSESDDVRPLLLEVPKHQCVDIARWPTGRDALERLRQPRQWIDFVHVSGLDERGECRPGSSPPAFPANRLFSRTIAWGRMARSTMLESIWTRPSWRKRSKASRRLRA